MKQFRKLTALLLSAALICSCALTMGATAPQAEWNFVPGYIDDGFTAPVSQRGVARPYVPGVVGSTVIPEEFDLRDVNGSSYMTSVKNQGSYGTCWAHASMASVESNLLMTGQGTYDLSELQAVYYAYNRNETVAAGGGDYAYYDPQLFLDVDTGDPTNLLMVGGNSIYVANAMAAQLGLIYETELPYSSVGRFTTTSAATLKTELDDSYARDKNVVAMDYYYEINLQNSEAIKRQLMAGGAGTISYCHANAFLASDKVSYYCNVAYGSNHAVTLCGWDDNYDKNKFSTSPSANGAWLCKNSWGTTMGNGGYFWISYEDASLTDVSFFGAKPVEDDYDNLYQHDGGIESLYFSESYFGNVFTAEGNELLKAVRIQTTNADTDVTVKVYTGVKDVPTSGTLQPAATTNAVCNFAGFYTIELQAPVSLTAGEKFAVVVQNTTSGGDVGLALDYTASYYGRVSHAEAQNGQSYMSGDGSSWREINLTVSLEGGGTDQAHCNARIKALTSDGDPFTPTGVTGDVNADGKLTIADAVLIMGHLLNDTMTGTRLQVADANGDLDVDEADVIWITRTLVDLTP